MTQKTETFFGLLKAETAKCWIVNDGIEDLFIPKSQMVSMVPLRDDNYQFEVPLWLAKQKGIV